MTTTTRPSHLTSFYQPELDALRFFAFVGVLLHHKSNPIQLSFLERANPLEKAMLWGLHIVGSYGVQLFFILSSYLITRLLLKEMDTRSALDLRSFYIRRALRIWPLYFFFLALCWFFARVLSMGDMQSGFLLSAVFFVGNWYIAYVPMWTPLALLWTISIEEQFYICWPLFLRSGKREKIRSLAIATIIISQLTLIWLGWKGPQDHLAIFANTLVEIQFFGIGALLALWAERAPVGMRRTHRALLALAGVALLFAASLFDPIYPSLSIGPLSYNILFILCALGVLAIFRAVIGTNARWYPAWLLFLGKISYGLYIFNLFATFMVLHLLRNRIPIMLEFVAVVVMNVGLAMFTWFTVERPFLRLKSRFEIVKSRPA
jgi:peptidoglycan/LPS O-acetylase OafA/YrhL